MDEIWKPPFSLFGAGRQSARTARYCHDDRDPSVRCIRRILVKRTISGEGVLYRSGKRHAVPAGSLFVIGRPGDNVYRYEGDGEPWRFEFVSFRCADQGPMLPDSLLTSPVLPAPDGSLLAQALQELIVTHFAGAGETLETSELAYRFYVDLIRNALRGTQRNALAEKVRGLIEEGYAEDLQFNQVAKDLSMTPEGLCRSFKSEFGMPPGQYLQRVRIRHAQRLLGEGGLALKEVAAACGYASANYFGRCFRRATGMTPKTFRLNPQTL